MDQEFLETIMLTLKLAVFTTLILIVIGLPLARYLSFSEFKAKPLFEALISMPMVIPPSVLGYYLLLAYSPQYYFGQWLHHTFQIRLAFTFEGILIASVLFNLPFMVQPLQNGMTSIPYNLIEASYTLGKSKITTFFKVILPNIKSAIITAIALTFAHCIGEFGVILIIGGNLPGKTRVASIAIYDQIQTLNFQTANKYALVLFLISFVLLTTIYSVNRKMGIKFFK